MTDLFDLCKRFQMIFVWIHPTTDLYTLLSSFFTRIFFKKLISFQNIRRYFPFQILGNVVLTKEKDENYRDYSGRGERRPAIKALLEKAYLECDHGSSPPISISDTPAAGFSGFGLSTTSAAPTANLALEGLTSASGA